MASSTLKTTKDGRRYYFIQVSRGYGNSPYTTRWYIPDGWSKTAIAKGLKKAEDQFERDCKEGKVLSRQEKKDLEKQKLEEESKIKTLMQYGEQIFLPAKEISCKGHTYSHYKNILNNHIYKEAFANMKLPEVTSSMISAFLLRKQKDGLSHATVIHIHQTLNQLFKMAYFEDLIPCNPMDKVQRPKKPKTEIVAEEVEAYKPEELQYILECLDKEPLKWKVFITLMANTGIRKGEACGLKWEYVNYNDCTIRIVENVCYTPERGVYVDTPKTGKARTIPVNPAVMALLKQLQKQQDEETKRRAKRLEKEGKDLEFKKISTPLYVFQEKGYNDPMFPDSPTRYFKKFGEKYGIEHFHPHKLRHTFASIAITSGADVVSVSQILGHADVSTTLRVYSHASQESMKKASEVFTAAIASKAKQA